MKRNFHLIGEVNQHEIDHLIEYILSYDEVDGCVYNDQFRDLEIETHYKNVDDIIERCIDELKFNLRVKERKIHKNNVFEKRYFEMTNFDAPESQVFLQSYLTNDDTIRSVEYNLMDHILTVETNDPFIYNKITYITSGLQGDIKVEEIFSQEKMINVAFLTRLLSLAAFIVFACLAFVGRKTPGFMSEVGWVGMYAMLVYFFADAYYDDVKEKRYFTYPLIVIITTFTMLYYDYHFPSIVGLVAAIWLYVLYKEVRALFTTRIIEDASTQVSTVRKKDGDQYIETQVSDIQSDDIVVYGKDAIVHFNGIILEGEATIDTCLMSGEEEYQNVSTSDRIQAGSYIVEGGIEMKVVDHYYSTALYRLHRFNPKEIHMHGYLENKERKLDYLYSLAMILIGTIIMIVGVIFSDIGKHHFIMSGLVCIYISYPLGILRMRPLFFQAFKHIALKNGVVFLNENSLNRFLELARKKNLVYVDDDMMKFHKGGYNNTNIVSQYNIIYNSDEDLQNTEKIAYRINELWKTNKMIMIVMKLVLSVLFLLSIFSFNLIVFINICVNLVIIYRSNRVLNQIL